MMTKLKHVFGMFYCQIFFLNFLIHDSRKIIEKLNENCNFCYFLYKPQFTINLASQTFHLLMLFHKKNYKTFPCKKLKWQLSQKRLESNKYGTNHAYVYKSGIICDLYNMCIYKFGGHGHRIWMFTFECDIILLPY